MIFRPSDWSGALPTGYLFPPTSTLVAGDADPPVSDWIAFCQPTYSQHGPSCVGHAWANWMEAMIRRYVPGKPLGRMQIDGHAIWLRARERFYASNPDGGITLPQGFAAAKDLGILPLHAQLLAVPHHWPSVGWALTRTPIVQAHHVHQGWVTPSRVNGCLDHAQSPTAADGYHATLRAGRIAQEGRRGYINLNSWGAQWGWHGCFVMTVEEDAEGLMPDGLYTASMPDGWETDTGWQKHLIPTPQQEG